MRPGKWDANDAAGICEAVTRPSMRFVGIKTQAQQDILLLHRIREQKVKARTALVNQIRGLLAEYGCVLNKTIEALRKGLLERVSDEGVCHPTLYGIVRYIFISLPPFKFGAARFMCAAVPTSTVQGH